MLVCFEFFRLLFYSSKRIIETRIVFADFYRYVRAIVCRKYYYI